MDIAALLKAYGAPDNAANVNALTQRYANDPTAADRKIHGLQGQSDESGGSRDAILNMMIDSVAAPTAVQNEPLAPLPMVQNASAPTRRGATAGSTPRAGRQQGYGEAGDPLANGVNAATPARPDVAGPASTPQDWSTLDFLAPLIGILGAGALAKPVYNAVGKRIAPTTPPEATFAGPMNKNIVPDNNIKMGPDRIGSDVVKQGAAAENPNAKIAAPIDWDVHDVFRYDNPNRALEQNIKADNRAPSTVTGSPENEVLARKAQHQAELDAANTEGDAVQKQMLEQANKKKKKSSFSPMQAIKNATGRK